MPEPTAAAPHDPARAIAAMLAKLDESDKDTFNWCLAIARSDEREACAAIADTAHNPHAAQVEHQRDALHETLDQSQQRARAMARAWRAYRDPETSCDRDVQDLDRLAAEVTDA